MRFRTPLLLLSLSAIAGAATISFDDVDAGTTLTNQYASQGVAFSGKFSTSNNYFGGLIQTVSAPNWVDAGGDYQPATISFADPSNSANAALASAVSFEVNGLNSNGDPFSYLDGLIATAYDQYGNQIGGSESVDPVDATVGRNTQLVSFTGDIAYVTIQRVANPAGEGANPIDDLNFTLESTTATPEPSTLAMLAGASGLFAFGCFRKK